MPRRVHIAPQIRFHSTSGKFYVTLVKNKRTPLGRLPKGRTWKKGDPVPLDVQRAYARAIAKSTSRKSAARAPRTSRRASTTLPIALWMSPLCNRAAV